MTPAGYAYGQLRDTQLSVQTDVGTDLGATEPIELDGFCCLGFRREAMHGPATRMYRSELSVAPSQSWVKYTPKI